MEIVKELEPWAVSLEQERHLETLKTYGERVALRRVWKFADFQAGLTTRCTVCNAGATGSIRDRISAVYAQSGDAYCSACLGTGYTGSFEPTIYYIWTLARGTPKAYTEGTELRGGVMPIKRPEVQFPWTPTLDPGDLVVRFRTWTEDVPSDEDSRYILRNIERRSVRTGPRLPQDDILVAQMTTMQNLPQKHPYYGVSIS